jgi:hypothetical protein
VVGDAELRRRTEFDVGEQVRLSALSEAGPSDSNS